MESAHPSRIDKAVAVILARQLADGGFNIYRKGPAEISASIKAYFALKVAGFRGYDPRMVRLARPDSGTRRTAGGQQLRSHQSEPV